MLLVRFVLKAIKVLNSETSVTSIAAACALGCFLGCAPWPSLQVAIAVLAVLFLRINITTTIVVGLLVAMLPLAAIFDGVGVALLENDALLPLWSVVTNHSIGALLRCAESIALGGTVVGFAAMLPAWFAGRLGVSMYRSKIEGWMMRSKVMRSLGGLKIVSLYRSVTTPFG